MSTEAWIILLAVTVPMVGLLLYLFFDNSVVRIPSGKLGLLMIKGKATRRTLLPGPHIVPAFRRRSVQEYPSVELAYRAGDAFGAVDPAASQLERSGPAIRATLGDRTDVTVACTVRVQLIPDELREVHERLGPDGIWSFVRDATTRTIDHTLSDAKIGVADVVGSSGRSLEERLANELRDVLKGTGIALSFFSLGDVDLGRTGEVIQATVRAKYELEREQAEAALRVARARNDAELQPFLTGAGTDAALRYREAEVWRELAHRPDVALNLPGPRRTAPAPAPQEVGAEPAADQP